MTRRFIVRRLAEADLEHATSCSQEEHVRLAK
jgi:hypothetical protein